MEVSPAAAIRTLSSWDRRGERTLKELHQAFTYQRNVCSQRVREQITTVAASISAEYRSTTTSGSLGQNRRATGCTFAVSCGYWVLCFINRLQRKETQLSSRAREAYLGVGPPLPRHSYSTADGAEQVTHGAAVCMSARVVKNTLTLTLAPALLA